MAKSAWLQEVEDDAVRIQSKRFRDQEEERQYKLSKESGEVTDSADEASTPKKKGK